MISSHLQTLANEYAETTLAGKFLGKEDRERVVGSTLHKFHKQARAVGFNAMRNEKSLVEDSIKRQVKEEVKTFLPFIFMAIASFLIQKLLGWLWDNYTTSVSEPD